MSDKAQPAGASSPPEGESSETEVTSSSEAASGTQAASLFGRLRTRLIWTPADNATHLDVRQYLQNKRGLELRYKGRLHTRTGAYRQSVQVQRIFSQSSTPSLARVLAAERGYSLDDGADVEDPQRFLPAGVSALVLKDWTLAPGLRVLASHAQPAGDGGSGSSSSSDGLRYCLTLRKQPQVLLRRGSWDSWLEAKADLEVERTTQQAQRAGLQASLRVKALRINVTESQDLVLAAGLDYLAGATSKACGASGLSPYLKLAETSWSIKLQRNQLSFTYEA